jgi:hypothetical protein
VYHLEVRTELSTWKVSHRYREFRRFYKQVLIFKEPKLRSIVESGRTEQPDTEGTLPVQEDVQVTAGRNPDAEPGTGR